MKMTFILTTLIVAITGAGVIVFNSFYQEQSNGTGVTIDTSFFDDNQAIEAKDTEIDYLKRSIAYGCYRFGLEGWEETLTYTANTRLRDNKHVFEAIPEPWDAATICVSYPNSIFTILVSHDLTGEDEIPADIISSTEELFPELSSLGQTGDQVSVYSLYIYVANIDSDITVDDQTRTLTKGEFVPLAKFAWDQVMSGCHVAQTSFQEGKVVVACGSGANMCWDEERVSFDIFSGEVMTHSVCKSNCDLAEGENYQLTCTE
ncbi:hypothetical protein KKG41_06895 [Patescibacteria group bacterium]|nr:hypothetical protein [Patescibacteria group bacterium]MBU1890454.1 hypothetical protein [Patescibacteria group bacterium]